MSTGDTVGMHPCMCTGSVRALCLSFEVSSPLSLSLRTSESARLRKGRSGGSAEEGAARFVVVVIFFSFLSDRDLARVLCIRVEKGHYEGGGRRGPFCGGQRKIFFVGLAPRNSHTFSFTSSWNEEKEEVESFLAFRECEERASARLSLNQIAPSRAEKT